MRTLSIGFSNPIVAVAYIISILLLGMHLYHGLWSMFQTLGAAHPTYTPKLKAFAKIFTVIIVLGFISVPIAILAGFRPGKTSYDTRFQSSFRSDRNSLGPRPLRAEARKPGEQAQIHRACRRLGTRGRLRRRDAGRTRIQRQVFLFPGFASARPLHRGAGRDQRREELPERRR